MTRDPLPRPGVPPLVIGERINAHGSRAVQRMLQDGDYGAIAEVARAQIAAGAHALDVCVAMKGRDDEAEQMIRVVTALLEAVHVPLAIDSTDPAVIERALDHMPRGRGIVNSINLAGRTRIEVLVPVATAHDAAIVALCIDEHGMARTRQRKLEVARRLYDRIVNGYGVPAHALLIDALTFPIGADGEDSAVETVEGVRLIKRELPDILTVLGISDVSYGLAPATRPALNSAFLRRCVEAGLDAAIVDPANVTQPDR